MKLNLIGQRCFDKFRIKLGIILFFAMTAAGSIGSPAGTPETPPSWLEHWDLARVLYAALFALIAWFLIRTLNKIDSNQAELFRRLIDVEKSHAELKGRCDAMMCNGGE